jgi:hypothetical protein
LWTVACGCTRTGIDEDCQQIVSRRPCSPYTRACLTTDSLRTALTELYEGWQPHLVNQGATTNRFLFAFWEPLKQYVSFSTEFDGPFVPSIYGATWEAARADPVLRSALVYAVGFARLQGRQLTGQIERTEGLIVALDAELARY